VSRDGSLTSQVPRPARETDTAGTSYARPLPAADPDANRLPRDPHHPRAALQVPDGHLAVQMANATHGASVPGQVLVLPYEQGRDLVRCGLAREVRTG